MSAARNTITLFFHILICSTVFSQLRQPAYNLQKDDSVLRKSYYEQAFQDKNNLIASLGPTYKKDYQKIYEDRFTSVAELLQSSRSVTDHESNNYLHTLLIKIIEPNPNI